MFYKNIIIEILKILLIIVPVLISVAFLTLAERKILGYSQNRKGPNIVGIYGLLQPLSDGIKLFSKEIIIPNHVNIFLYFFAPIISLTLALSIWCIIPLNKTLILCDINLSLLVIFALSSISVYAILISGWTSNSKYAFLGALRASAQMISYEVCIGLIFLNIIIYIGGFNLNLLSICQNHSIIFLIPYLPISFMFFISCLAETNRSPFDLTEGESELVSGYNVEYSSMSFALFFLAEYSHIIFMSFLFTIFFLGETYFSNYKLSYIYLYIKVSFIVFIFIWVRATFPRLRYDHLMSLIWKTYLPLSISIIIFLNFFLWSFEGLNNKTCL